MWAESIISSDKRVNYLMASSVQNSLKTMFFKDYSLLVVFDAYLRRKCTIPDIYTCNCAGLVVIRSLRTAPGSLKEERRRRRTKMNNSRGRRFLFTTLETSARFANGISTLKTIAWSILDVWNLEKRYNSQDLQRPPWESPSWFSSTSKQSRRLS